MYWIFFFPLVNEVILRPAIYSMMKNVENEMYYILFNKDWLNFKINHLKRIMYLQLAIWRTQTCLSSGYKRKSIGQANVNEILEQKAENTWNVLKEKSVWICKFNLPMYSSRTNNHRGNVFISVTKNRKKLYLFSTGKQKTT